VPLSAFVANLECLPPKHCGWADGQQFGLGLDDGVDAFGDLAGPAVLAERGRLDQVAALDVRVVELAHVPEDPVPRQLRHGLLLHSLVVVEIIPEPIESGISQTSFLSNGTYCAYTMIVRGQKGIPFSP
jgi:hypothetical protein